jgi:hypothetical protein
VVLIILPVEVVEEFNPDQIMVLVVPAVEVEDQHNLNQELQILVVEVVVDWKVVQLEATVVPVLSSSLILHK